MVVMARIGVVFDWIESNVFHTNSWIGFTLGIIHGGLIGYSFTEINAQWWAASAERPG
jgi:hypothetical protein